MASPRRFRPFRRRKALQGGSALLSSPRVPSAISGNRYPSHPACGRLPGLPAVGKGFQRSDARPRRTMISGTFVFEAESFDARVGWLSTTRTPRDPCRRIAGRGFYSLGCSASSSRVAFTRAVLPPAHACRRRRTGHRQVVDEKPGYN